MKHRRVLVAGLVSALALVAALGVAAAGTDRPAGSQQSAALNAPAVKNAAAIKAKYKGQRITFIGDGAVGKSHTRDLKLVARFSRDTGIRVRLVPHPAASDAAYSQLARNFSAKSSAIDVMMLDIIWPGAFASYLVDLTRPLGKAAKQHLPGIIQNDTVGGRLIAMPWFGDFGILYYRTDLLAKYNYDHPPRTWAELETMARRIQNGERRDNNNFYGFVWQGNAYEGLTCNGLEWIASAGGGHIIDKGQVSINNKKAEDMLNMVRGWVGTIAPRDVSSYQENQAQTAFGAGNAAFMRNWPYAYAANQTQPVKGKFNVTVLPHGAAGTSVGTVGGWQLGVSKYSKHKGAAIELVRYLTSAPVQRFDAIYNTNVPTIPAVARLAAVVRANPYLKPEIYNVARVTRPSRDLRTHYAQGSQIIYQGLNQIENGQNAKNVLPQMEAQLKRLLR